MLNDTPSCSKNLSSQEANTSALSDSSFSSNVAKSLKSTDSLSFYSEEFNINYTTSPGQSANPTSLSEAVILSSPERSRSRSPVRSRLQNDSNPNTDNEPNIHQNPNWLKDLKRNFKEEIIDKCSARTISAVNENEYISEPKEFLRVKNEIVNTVLDKLKKVHGSVGKPGKSVMKEMMLKLIKIYPNMFDECDEPSKRQVPGLERQAALMCDRYREQLKRAHDAKVKAGLVDGEVEDSSSHQKGKKEKNVYGVNNKKWYNKKRLTPLAKSTIADTSTENDFIRRESIFEEHREELQSLFRNSKKNMNDISKICKGFFLDPRHLAHHFEYLCEASSLERKLTEHLQTFLGISPYFLFIILHS